MVLEVHVACGVFKGNVRMGFGVVKEVVDYCKYFVDGRCCGGSGYG